MILVVGVLVLMVLLLLAKRRFKWGERLTTEQLVHGFPERRKKARL